MPDTNKQYKDALDQCTRLFEKKAIDYGTAWRILRLPSLTDQIFIKAQRIRSIQEQQTQKIEEGQTSEFIGIVNYSIMGLIQLDRGVVDQPDMTAAEALQAYQHFSNRVLN